MSRTDPVAFLSYVRNDDDHDGGRITQLRERLEGEVRIQTGHPFKIFQDRNDLQWGHQWKNRIEDALLGVTFLIPVITPSFFRSRACREEFSIFLLRKTLGEDQLILPVYYVDCDEMISNEDQDEISAVVRSRQWADWRNLRFEPLDTPQFRGAVAKLGNDILSSMRRLRAILREAETKSPAEIFVSEHTSSPEPTSQAPSKYSSSIAEVVKRIAPFSADLSVQAQPYYAYTKNFDEVISAEELSDPADPLRLHNELLNETRTQVALVGQDNLDVFSQEIREIADKHKVFLTLLIDNSGSMRGGPARYVASWSSIISRLLSEGGISNEVLGFTTRSWKGGQSRELWLAHKRIKSPGRLSDLRHIVYKSFHQTFQEADVGFSVMIREGLFKENVDGEALLWAKSRLIQNIGRRILIVISDGAPVDDSTLQSNIPTFLTDHLKSTVISIQASGDCELYGIGIGYDISKFYQDSALLAPEDLGQGLLAVFSAAVRGDREKVRSIRPETPKPMPAKRRRTRSTDP